MCCIACVTPVSLHADLKIPYSTYKIRLAIKYIACVNYYATVHNTAVIQDQLLL